jgi:hypothetical protein
VGSQITNASVASGVNRSADDTQDSAHGEAPSCPERGPPTRQVTRTKPTCYRAIGLASGKAWNIIETSTALYRDLGLMSSTPRDGSGCRSTCRYVGDDASDEPLGAGRRVDDSEAVATGRQRAAPPPGD